MVFSKSKSNYLVYCAHGNQALNAYGGHKAKEYNLENLRSILSVGEPLNAEAVIWGEENFGFYYGWWQTETGGIMIANYPSMKVKPVPWENLCLRNCHCEGQR
jgi:acyl-coenzyme A synthetase/AMP-(fatty) acid ligase